MVLNEDIKIDFHVPRTLKEYMDIADEVYHRVGDDIDYSFAIEDVEGLAKEYMLRGTLTEVQCYRILARYGLR